ncbi:MAG: rod shape-determining protein MreD [Lachnospiraceae bacterium]|nr:rod shape-determining protein MreD [Lachnospiraceae bacterium]
MKRFIVTVLLLITLFVFQGTVFASLNFANTSPNLLIILIVSLSLMRGEKTGVILGFFAGILMDVFMGTTIGLYALIFMYLGYANGSFHRVFFPEDIKLPMIMIVVSDIFYGFLVYILLFLLRGRTDFSFYFSNVILPEAIYTIVITILLYPLILWINKLLTQDEQRKAKRFVS